MARTGSAAADAAGLVRLAYYPFLPEVREAVRELGPDLGAVLTSPLYAGVRSRACERVEGALENGIPPVAVTDERGALMELLSVPIARMLVVRLGERQLTQRYAQAEAFRVHGALSRDPELDALDRAAAAVGLPLVADGDAGGYRLHFADFLRAAPSDPAWKLVLRTVDKGQVRIDRKDAVRLVQEALSRRVLEELEAEKGKPMPAEVEEALEPLVDRVTPKLDAARDSWTSGDFGPVQPELFPPCI